MLVTTVAETMSGDKQRLHGAMVAEDEWMKEAMVVRF